MNSRLIQRACIFFCILFSGFVINSFNQLKAQDLIITNIKTFRDTAITLSGNLIIKEGGNLELNGVTLQMNCRFDGQYKIEVESGGILSILDSCIIGAVNPDYHYAFSIHGSSFTMKNSRLSGVGWGPKGANVGTEEERYSGEKGLYINSKSAIIDNNTFTGNYVGIILADSLITFSNNQLNDNIVHGILNDHSNCCQILKNTIKHGEGEVGSSPFVIKNGHYNVIRDNIIESEIHAGIIETYGSNGNRFEGNHISGWGVGICLMFLCNNNSVSNNTISTDECGIMVWGWNNSILNNTVSSDAYQLHTGIYMIYCYNSYVADNKFLNIGEEHGMWMRHCSNNKIINNHFSSVPASSEYNDDFSSGIMLYRNCKHNIISQNSMDCFAKGISLFFGCDSNYINDNQIENSKFQAMIFENSGSNYIFSNNRLMNNGKPVYSNSENFFDYSGILPEDIFVSHPPEVTSVDWNGFSGHLIVEGQTAYFSNAHASAGDTLTLRNMTLITGRTTDDVSGIEPEPGGTLILDNCKFIHDLYGHGFVFGAPKGSSLIMKNCSIYDCGQEWWYGGIQIYTDNIVLENNNFYGTIISLFGTNGGIITGNKIYDSYTALNIENVKNINFTGNLIDGSAKHAIIGGKSNLLIKNNTIKNVWGKGIHICDTNNSIIDGNEVSNIHEPCSAIDIWGENIDAINNKVSNSYRGFNLSDGMLHGSVKNNRVKDCTIGMEVSATNMVEGNIVSNCQSGIGGDTLKNNIVTNCGIGLGGNVLSGNSIDSCRIGILNKYNVSYATNNLISHCDTGIVLKTRGNVFHHNDLINNDLQAFDDISGNYWDFEGYGNFWSDYAGPDENSDGIGDIPFIVPPGVNQDNFPLLSPDKIEFKPAFIEVTPKSLVPGSFMPGDTNIFITQFTLILNDNDSVETVKWSGLHLDRIGTGADSDISSVKIWKDKNSDEEFNCNTDTVIGDGNFISGKTLIMLYDEETVTLNEQNYFVTFDINNDISATGNTLGILCPDSSYFICPYPVKVLQKNLPFQSDLYKLPVISLSSNSFFVSKSFPNPVRNKTTINYSISEDEYVLIQVLNSLGQTVKILMNNVQPAGKYSIEWTGRDNFNKTVENGIYILKLVAGENTDAHKLILLK